MKQTIWQRIDLGARNLTPFALTVLLVLVAAAPTHIDGFVRVAPLLPLIAVYHWSIYRPELLPAVGVFAVGLLQDLLGGGPLGAHTAVLLGVYGAVLTQRGFFYGKTFAIIWLGFGLVAAGAVAATWLLVSVYYLRPIQPQAFLFQYLMTLMAFPPVSWLLLRWQRSMLGQE
jgi:rod shape-determining protein MreD